MSLYNKMSVKFDQQSSDSVSKFLCALIVSTLLFLPACQDAIKSDSLEDKPSNDSSLLEANSQVFSGCYTVDMSEPAQIKISLNEDGLVMQMKEPASANRVWDDPEPLEVISNEQVPNYFSIDTEHVTNLIARPDKMLVMAHVNSAYANMDPLLDSEYLAYILQGANTIYKVECDDVHSNEDSAEEAPSVSIKTVQSVDSQ